MDNGTLCAKDNLREGQRPTILSKYNTINLACQSKNQPLNMHVAIVVKGVKNVLSQNSKVAFHKYGILQ